MDKTAIVTGAAGGIGFATVKKLVSEGFCVAAADVVSEEMAMPMFSER